MKARLFTGAGASIFATAFTLVAGCGSDFSPKNEINGVRILAVRADQPYARPGETVKLELLTHDGRTAPAEPIRIVRTTDRSPTSL